MVALAAQHQVATAEAEAATSANYLPTRCLSLVLHRGLAAQTRHPLQRNAAGTARAVVADMQAINTEASAGAVVAVAAMAASVASVVAVAAVVLAA